MALRIGDILVQLGVLSEHDRQTILDQQRTVAKPFGELAERLFAISPDIIEDAWARQYEQIAGTINPMHFEIDPSANNCITARQAWQFRILPIRFEQGELMLATTRQNLPRALRFSATQMPEMCFFVTAEPEDLAKGLQRSYPMPGFGLDTISEPSPKLSRRVG